MISPQASPLKTHHTMGYPPLTRAGSPGLSCSAVRCHKHPITFPAKPEDLAADCDLLLHVMMERAGLVG